jgi:hypothetical protein
MEIGRLRVIQHSLLEYPFIEKEREPGTPMDQQQTNTS